MLANADQLKFADLFLYFLGEGLESTFFDCGVGNSGGEGLEIEVGDITLVALEVRVIAEVLVELVPPRLPLQQYVFAVSLELILYF